MRPVVGVAVGKDRVVACAVLRGRTIWAAEASWHDPADLAAVLASLAAARPRSARLARVALCDGVVRFKTLAGLPRLARTDLAAHVQLHSRRYFLQNGVPLVTDARAGPLGVLAAAVPVPLADAIESGLAAAGLRCDAMVPGPLLDLGAGADTARVAAAVAGLRRSPLSLLSDGVRARRREADRRQLRGLVVAAIAALTLAGVSRVWSLSRRAHSATTELARLGLAADAALQVRRDLDDATAALVALPAGQGNRGARLLADVARLLPDSAFLATFRVDNDGTVRLSGYATSAARALAQLERLPGAQAASFDGPLTREIVGGRERERFTITLRMRS